jgi:hypothetical protein
MFWEDEQAQLDDPDFDGGVKKVSLRQAQKNFLKFGASEEKMISYVRPVNFGEPKDQTWKPFD